jgi:transglutaminase superfamily protein
MFFLVLRAYIRLTLFDLYLARGKFSGLHDKIRNCQLGKRQATSDLGERLCRAVDIACICYWKEVLCLQRSAATACLLRHCGVAAKLVIGAQQMPFTAHAWVEVDGRVVNDKPYITEIYAVLDRC